MHTSTGLFKEGGEIMLPYQKNLALEKCEVCGYSGEGLHRHHVRARGNKKDPSLDKRENLICLCGACHTKAHAGNIPAFYLIALIAKREGATAEEIMNTIGFIPKSDVSEFRIRNTDHEIDGISLESAIQAVLTCTEAEEDIKWKKATLIAQIADYYQINNSAMASLCGCSPALIRNCIVAYKAFPEPHMRAADKSFTLHLYAAKTKEPEKWLQVACEHDLSTRQLKEAIEVESVENTIERDVVKEKAERIIRMTKEVMNADSHIGEWLIVEIKNLFKTEDKNDNNTRVA